MQAVRFPSGLAAIGFSSHDVYALVDGAYPQQRVLKNAPRAVSKDDLARLFSARWPIGSIGRRIDATHETPA
jgi:alcohol dehydrogenase class IV